MKYFMAILLLAASMTACNRQGPEDMHFGPEPGDEEYSSGGGCRHCN